MIKYEAYSLTNSSTFRRRCRFNSSRAGSFLIAAPAGTFLVSIGLFLRTAPGAVFTVGIERTDVPVDAKANERAHE